MKTILISAISWIAVLGVQPQAADKLTFDDLFPNDRVLDVRITVTQDNWDTLRYQRNTFLSALHESRKTQPPDSPYAYVPARVTIDDVEFPDVAIRKKGFIGSHSTIRPSLKIKLNHTDPDANIGGLNNLTLNNNKQDVSLVSQYLGYALFNDAGLPAPRCAFARVSVNGTSLGIYAHVETARPPLIRRGFGDDSGTLYEGTVADFFEGWADAFEHKFGKNETAREHIRSLIQALHEKTEKTGEIEERIDDYVDLDSFYTYWAMEGLLGFWDGYSGNSNNYFIYLHPKTKRFHFLPWGADSMFVRRSPIGFDRGSPLCVKTRGLITHALYQSPRSRERYQAALRGLLTSHWDENSLVAETRRIETMVQPHVHERQKGFARHLEETREFIRTRRRELVAEMDGGMPEWPGQPSQPMLIPGPKQAAPQGPTLGDAAKAKDERIIRNLLAKGADVNLPDEIGNPPLTWAAMAGGSEIVQVLLQSGADVNPRGQDGSTPLHGAAFFGRKQVVETLLQNGADPNLRNGRGETPLDTVTGPMNPMMEGMMRMMGELMGLGVDPEAARAARPEIAALLRSHGGESGNEVAQQTPANIWMAAKQGATQTLKTLLDDSPDLDGQDELGLTPLAWAALNGHREVAAILIRAGADPNGKNRDGGRPLHGAAFFGKLDTTTLLLKNGADVNARNGRGETPLDTVAQPWNEGIQNVLQFVGGLLQVDVDIDAIKTAHPKVAALLRENGGKTSNDLP